VYRGADGGRGGRQVSGRGGRGERGEEVVWGGGVGGGRPAWGTGR